jgi:hypothetical protein
VHGRDWARERARGKSSEAGECAEREKKGEVPRTREVGGGSGARIPGDVGERRVPRGGRAVEGEGVAEPPELFQLKCLSDASRVATHLNRNNPSVPQI